MGRFRLLRGCCRGIRLLRPVLRAGNLAAEQRSSNARSGRNHGRLCRSDQVSGICRHSLQSGRCHLACARPPGQWRRCLPLLLFPAILLVAPWLIKNVVEVRNPVSPFANRLFPNPYVHVAFEDESREGLAHPNHMTWPEVPLELTVYGDRLQGLFGPLFLLAPLGLFALRWPVGRQVLPAGLVFALTYP